MTLNSTVSEHAIIQFSNEVHVRMQQSMSRLQPYCEMRQVKGKSTAYDGLGTVELEEITGRHAAVEFSDIEHNRRKLTTVRFGATLPIDKQDVEERLTNPESGYAAALAKAAKRRVDRVVYAAMFATVKTGEEMGTDLTFANDGGRTVDATAGLTYEKLLEIHQNFIDDEVGNDEDMEFVMGITGDEHTDLMSELELTSGDYSRQYVVDQGTIQQAAGIKMLKFAATGAGGANPILTVASGTRTTFCMAKGAICLGVLRDWQFKVQERTDLVDTYQVQILGRLGAVRVEGKMIQKVTTTD
jgi:hypothetical protein